MERPPQLVWPPQIPLDAPIFMSRLNDAGDWELPADFEVWDRPDEALDPASKSLLAVEGRE